MDIIPLTKEQEDACLKDIGLSRQQLKEDVATLREWVKSQHHLPPSRLKESDFFYIHYIMGCKGSLEKCKKKIDAYYSFRGSGCSFYENNEPLDKNVVKAKQYYDVALVPKCLPDGSRVTLYRVAANPEDYDYTMCSKLNMQLYELCIRKEEISPATCYAVFDLKNVSTEHLLKVNPGVVRDLLHVVKEILPFRVIKAIGYNCNPYISYTINSLVKPLLPKKMASRFHLTSAGSEELFDFLPKDVLPSDLGGTQPSLHDLTQSWYKVAEEKREWFLTDLTEKTDESKRTVESWDNPYFGLEGSIKKLCVD